MILWFNGKMILIEQMDYDIRVGFEDWKREEKLEIWYKADWLIIETCS